MSTPHPKVIAYAYSASPMWQKVYNVLLLRRIPYSIVSVKSMPPRPPLLQLGITYRRIPVIMIGDEVFFDTNIVFQELERRFKPEDGFPSLVSIHPGLQEIGSIFWSDRVLFPLASTFMQADRLPAELKKDRKEYNPASNFEVLEARRPAFLSELRAQLAIITRQLASSKTPYLLSTPAPSFIDVTAYSLLAWAYSWKTATSVLVLPSSKAPPETRRAMEWFESVKSALNATAADPSNPAAKPSKITGDEAMQALFSTSSASPSKLTIDPSDPLIQAKWIAGGDVVTVTPTDTGKVPQLGRLAGLTADSVSISIQAPSSEKTFVGHFPRLGYSIQRVKGGSDIYARL